MNHQPVIQIQIKNEPRIDSRLIADSLGVKHKTTHELITRYQDRLKRFGVVPFKTEKPPEGSAGGRPERYAMLNENQTYLLLTFSRNTDKK